MAQLMTPELGKVLSATDGLRASLSATDRHRMPPSSAPSATVASLIRCSTPSSSGCIRATRRLPPARTRSSSCCASTAHRCPRCSEPHRPRAPTTRSNSLSPKPSLPLLLTENPRGAARAQLSLATCLEGRHSQANFKHADGFRQSLGSTCIALQPLVICSRCVGCMVQLLRWLGGASLLHRAQVKLNFSV